MQIVIPSVEPATGMSVYTTWKKVVRDTCNLATVVWFALLIGLPEFKVKSK